MKERPIIFSGQMVNAILAGRKTQTRRVITTRYQQCLSPEDEPQTFVKWCPYGQPGDRLWVRETWGVYSESWTDYGWEGDGISDMAIPKRLPLSTMHTKYHVVYKESGYEADEGERWRPSIHMPRWASRITLEIVNVRIERVQDISRADMRAEGIAPHSIVRGALCDDWHPQKAFAELWDSINGKRGYGWDTNPWVWVIEFKREGTQ